MEAVGLQPELPMDDSVLEKVVSVADSVIKVQDEFTNSEKYPDQPKKLSDVSECEPILENKMTCEKYVNPMCLACSSPIGVTYTDSKNSNRITSIDFKSLQTFISEIYHVAIKPAFEEENDSMTSETNHVSSRQPENPFCTKCTSEIQLLHNLHVNMQESIKKFAQKRDKIAFAMVETFFMHDNNLHPTRPEEKIIPKNDIFKRWKSIYTGEEEKEKEVIRLVKERESRSSIREKRIAQIKGSLRRSSLTPLTRPEKDIDLPGKRMAKIQRAMTACYFTPKLSVIRRKNKLYFRVGIPSKTDTKFMCPICDKEFARKDTMTIHVRSHATGSEKLYKCSICDKVCSDRQKLIEHRKTHTEDQKRLQCIICDKIFTKKSSLKSHVKSHEEIRIHSCEMCDKTFSSSHQLKKHTATHINVDFSVTDLYSCKQCSKTFLKSKDMNDHLKIHVDDKLFGCEFCGKGFKDSAVLKEHSVVHLGGNPYICEECDQRFASEALLVSHLKNHRPKEYICEECGKACRSRDGLRKHELTHTGTKPFSCQICDIGFIERKSFDAHMVKHTGKLPYKCNLCKLDEGFKDAKDLRRHKVEKHPDLVAINKRHACEFCWNGFSTTGLLQEHVTKVHERYKCHLCGRVFKLGDHLRRHMYIHTGEKPYKCTLCHKSFNQISNLTEHTYRHTGIRPHRCPYCPDVGYLRRMHLKEHMMKEHGTDKVPSLPMGRAAQNARRAGQHPVPIVQTESIGDLVEAEMKSEVASNSTTEAVQSINSSLDVGSPVFLTNVPNTSTEHQQKVSPLIMRSTTAISRSGQAPIMVRRVASNVSAKKPTPKEEEIPTIHIKTDKSRHDNASSDIGDPNQQYIIFL